MTDSLLVALLSLAGTLAGSLGGILTSNRLVAYRLSQLEEKVNKHNNLVERMAVAEERLENHQKQLETMERESAVHTGNA